MAAKSCTYTVQDRSKTQFSFHNLWRITAHGFLEDHCNLNTYFTFPIEKSLFLRAPCDVFCAWMEWQFNTVIPDLTKTTIC